MERIKKTGFWKKGAVRLLCSYLVIILAPGIAIVIIYVNMCQALLEIQLEKITNVQGEAAACFDRELDRAVHVLSRISEDPDVEEYLQESGGQNRVEEYLRSFHFASEDSYSAYKDGFLKGIYVFPKTGNYFVRFPGVFPMDSRGLSNFPALKETVESQTFWEDLKALGEGLIFFQDAGGESAFLILHVVKSSADASPLGVVAVELDTGEIRSLLRQILGGNEGGVYLTDEKGNILLSGNRQEDCTGINLSELAKTSVILEKATDYNRWKFVCAVPKKTLAARAGNLRYLISVLCVCSLFVGLGICIWYWWSNLKIAEQYERLRAAYQPEKNAGKRRTWGRDLLEIMNRVEEMQRTVLQRQKWAQEGIVRKLLEGGYPRMEDMEKEVKRLGIPLPVAVPCLVAVLKAEKSDGREEELFARLNEELDRHLSGAFCLLQETVGIYTVLLPGKEGEHGMHVLLEQIQYRLAGAGLPRIYAGIGKEATEWSGVSLSYEQAGSSAAYAFSRKIPVPVSYETILSKSEYQSLTQEQQRQKNEIERLIRQEYGNADFNLAILADRVGISEKKLYREFKKMYGQSFSGYLEALRLQEAEKRLLAGEAVQEVAAAVGYNSDYSFRRAFKRVTGLTPSTRQKQASEPGKKEDGSEEIKMSGSKKNCPLA